MITNKEKLPYEEAAEQVTLTGWACKTCGHFWRKDEHMARYCCAKDMACECGARIRKSEGSCWGCRSRDKAVLWHKLVAEKSVAWDGKTPLSLWDDDQFFWTPEDLADYLEVSGERSLEELRLVLCVENKPPYFNLADFLQDTTYEDFDDQGEFADIEKPVNDFLQGKRPWSWYGSDKPVTAESVRAVLDKTRGGA